MRLAFNDPAGLTCIGNDFGYPHLFEKPVEMFADPGDVLVAISSSRALGKHSASRRRAARAKGCLVMTLTGFAHPEEPAQGQGRRQLPR